MAEYSRLAHGTFTSTGASQVINLPFQPDYVEFTNYTSAATPANHGIPFAKWDSYMGQGFAVANLFNATPVLTTDVVIANGISTFAAGTLLQYGARQQVVASTKATGNFQVTGHGYSTGDVVVFEGLYQTAVTGMPQICGMPFTITKVDANNFTINWNVNQSNFTALAGSPAGAYVKKVLYPYLYLPGLNFIASVTTGATTTVVTSTWHNYVVGQEVAFRIPASYGITQLNSLPNNVIPGSPIYGYVVSVTNNFTVVVNVNSTGFSAYNSNQTVASVPGLQFPQVVVVGDVNTGGNLINSTSPLYPSPQFPTSTGGVPTINGPAIKGAFVNNTSQGFVIGSGATSGDATASLVGANGNVIYWRALLHDFSKSQ